MLQEKWKNELKDKFNFTFKIYDRKTDLADELSNGIVKGIINYEAIRSSEKDRKEHREKMINRVAAEQIKIGHSIIIILGCSVIFGANMVFQFFSPISLFWTVVLLGSYYHKKADKVTPSRPI